MDRCCSRPSITSCGGDGGARPGKGAVAAAIATFTLAHLAFLLANGLYNAHLPKL
ncbi:hypothetical protein [Accumulibacter sp.]|uniref:hypothetical protein n=1 Tax=Accumulibacter sp. TaxID=2053492 RepID=UPI0025EA8110|nr:hypothetical protein [Accumulibacter sp.]MCM8610830.1 hypothetical protein [Accumulibacter sp.]MCM8635227.1 hypothetical protein [Accumulibacter sp.]MCM8638598.1 hypothetical protein [Accumulibacter sp.]